MLEQADRYTGYTAYDYLEAGKDYREFRYAKQIGRVPAYDLGLSDAQKERTERLLREETVISLHEHVQVFPEDMGSCATTSARAANPPATRASPAPV